MYFQKCNRILVINDLKPSVWEIVDISGSLEQKVATITMFRECGCTIKMIYPYFNVDDYIKESRVAGKSNDDILWEICQHSGLTIPANRIY